MEGSFVTQFKVLFRHLSRGTGENRFKRYDKRRSGRGSKRVPPEYRSEALVLEPTSAVFYRVMVLNDDCEWRCSVI